LALKGDERESFIEDMKPQLISLKKYNYGKQIIAIEKLIPSATPYNASTATTQIPPIETNSSTPTPMLTNGQNSPQSSSVPSESVSTMEDSTNPATSGKGIEIEEGVERGDKICPEVVINGV
jgi:mRNA-binding protein PUF3